MASLRSVRLTAMALAFFVIVYLQGPAFADAALRPLTTDRPDLTESPFTVNAGHIQVESTLFGYAHSRKNESAVREDTFEFVSTNVRLGLTDHSELNIAWQPYGIVTFHSKSHAHHARADGVGSLQVRGKFNLFGNDSSEQVGDTALALLPFVSIPTDQNNGIGVTDLEGGVIVPFAVVLPNDFGLGLNVGVSALKSNEDRGYNIELFLSAALSYEWTSRIGTYYEVAATFVTENSNDATVLLGTGFTYALNQDTQVDGGVNFGLTDTSDRWAPFFGLTRRF